ncbi:MAG: hypothetical protein KDB37_15745 [Ilumatobacter sp.]|nr:hypothetical protein [Ilumatobacter sp.]
MRDRSKTVTRRKVDSWQTLKPGDGLILIEKGMGLPKGAKQVVLCEVEVVDVRVEPISLMSSDVRYGRQEIALEGFDPNEWDPLEWATWWAGNHGHSIPILPDSWFPVDPLDLRGIECRRIQWRYLDEYDRSRVEVLKLQGIAQELGRSADG